MTHFDNHPHALIQNGAVLTVAVFAGHDEHEVFDAIKRDLAVSEIVCCCTLGVVPAVGDVWDGQQFSTPEVSDASVNE